jgi:5-methylcytosine-specific restriction endonuclease McrA
MNYISVSCQECKLFFNAIPSEVKRGNGKYCSKTCSKIAVARKQLEKYKEINQPNVECSYCHKMFYKNETEKKNSRSGLHFCCREHKDLAQRIGSGIDDIKPDHYRGKDMASDYRNYYRVRNQLIECQRCGYNKYSSILQIHHIDRNRKNNVMENLIVLCPNCHEEEHYENKDGRYGNKTIPSNQEYSTDQGSSNNS